MTRLSGTLARKERNSQNSQCLYSVTLLPYSTAKTAEAFWKQILIHFTKVELDYFVVMPNHIHEIVIIIAAVETPYMASLPLGEIIGKYKTAVTRWAKKNGFPDFSWQSRFYDRTIRDEKELFNIRKYIEQNPLNDT